MGFSARIIFDTSIKSGRFNQGWYGGRFSRSLVSGKSEEHHWRRFSGGRTQRNENTHKVFCRRHSYEETTE
jgi:hypothetical protein